MTDFAFTGPSLANEINELACARGEYQALRVLLPLTGDRAPMRRRLLELMAEVSHNEWPGEDFSAQPDEPRDPLSAAAVIMVADMHGTLSTYRDETSTARQRHDRTVLRYEWVINGAPNDTDSIRDFHGREVRARTRLPGERDSAILEYEKVVNEEIALAPDGMNFLSSLFQMNYASLLVRRATDEDFAIAEPLIRDGYEWRKKRFGGMHPFTMVATGNLVAAILRRIEDPEGKRKIVQDSVRPEVIATIETAEGLYRGRRAVLGDRSSSTALALLYLARLHQAKGDISAAADFAERSIAAMPDPPLSKSNTTLPMARVLLAECLVFLEGDERKIKRLAGRSETAEEAAKSEAAMKRARILVDSARPVLTLSAISDRWLSRIDNLPLMGMSEAELVIRERPKAR